MKNLIFVFALFASFSLSAAQLPGYKITVKIKGIHDTTLIMGHYYGKWQYTKDTARIDNNGIAVFETKDTIGGGIYFILLPNRSHFEFILDREREFTIETDTVDLIGNMKVKGSADNQLFFDYQRFIRDQETLIATLQKQLDALPKGSSKDSLALIDRMKKVNQDVSDYKLAFMKKNPTCFLSKVFEASKDPDLSEIEKQMAEAQNKPESDTIRWDLVKYLYFRHHFWDNVDLTDDRLLRTPIINNKLELYFDKVIPQIPDTIIPEVDRVIEMARPSKDMFKYVMWYLTYKYESSQIIGFDAIFVHIVNTYYKTGQAFWLTEKSLNNILASAKKKEPCLIGKTAPNLILVDTNMTLHSMHDIVATYTILYFWDPECGHCAKESPKLRTFYDNYKDTFDLEIFAICTDTSMTRWKKGIHDKKMEGFIHVNGTRSALGNYHDLYDIYSTPVVYILDDKKTIIFKRLPVDEIYNFLMQYRKRLKK